MITDGSRVSLEYTLTVDDGRVVSTSVGGDLFVYVHGQHQLPPLVEQRIEALAVNDSVRITLSAEDAYGPVNPQAFLSVPLETVPEPARAPGAVVEATDAEGGVDARPVRKVTYVLLLHRVPPKRGRSCLRDLRYAAALTPMATSGHAATPRDWPLPLHGLLCDL